MSEYSEYAIVTLAKQIGFLPVRFNDMTYQTEYSVFAGQIIEFARKIAEAQKEACAKACEKAVMGAFAAGTEYANGYRNGKKICADIVRRSKTITEQ